MNPAPAAAAARAPEADPGAEPEGGLRRLGVRPGARLMAHASLGGTGLRAEALRDALLGLLGPRGTLAVPAFTPENSKTSSAHLERIAGLSGEEVRAFRARMPAFDPARTPSHGMGAFAESVRTAPGAVRSAHPQTSFAAVGAGAQKLCAGHPLTSHLGEESPLGKMCGEGWQVLMINVGFSVCTAFHLAEYRIPKPLLRMYECVVKVNLPGLPGGQPRRRDGAPWGEGWTAYEDISLDDSDFAEIGSSFPEDRVHRGRVGGASAMLFSLPDAVDHAQKWMTENRR
ncbi:aminoglycoside N(3)-acetyltransferase [Streptomyces sp. NBC_00503]|uniref:aminoglycoside N(3)-acetyltransferase n=1 Tax=Streptomyces sp. NBC_00503 TaxID=2903659 RepID=UPI002E805835|nr:AAC(3) family N-acetyltransferase [Streptomyces sp. NBC_00503]WUD80556.1 AAC(3) family N-acetyltransferase [Streptomyces sp. NBC_00503]